MFKALLFDLDGTLLNIDMDIFLRHYFVAMIKKAGELGYKDYKNLGEQVYRSTDVMLANRCANTMNEEAFMLDFLAACSTPEQETRDFFNHFYQFDFPRLQQYCSPFPGVAEMMSRVFKKGYKVVIASNPVFPLAATQQRMDWAGVGHLPFELITSYENMHFTKPHLEYYQEICARIGVEPSDCLMIGNDVDEDLPAGRIGMKTFLVEDMLIDKGQSGLVPDWRGKLTDLFEFLDNL